MPNAQGQTVIADAYTLPDWDRLDKAGFDGVAFYVSHNTRKMPPAGYIAEGLRRGRILLPVAEDTGRGSAGGATAGRDFAKFVNAQLAAIGWPTDKPIANAESDYPATASPMVQAYYEAFHNFSDNKLIVTYADGEVGRMTKANGWAVAWWLTCSGGFPGSHDRTGADMWQRCTGEPGNIAIPGYSIDTNIILNNIFGHTPPPPVPQGDLDMATVQQLMDQAQLIHEEEDNRLKSIEAKLDKLIGGELIDISVDRADAAADGVKAPLSPPQTGPVAGAAPAPGAPPA